MKSVLLIALGIALFVNVPCATYAAPQALPLAEQNWQAHPNLLIRKPATAVATGYSPSQLHHAYGLDSTSATGKGQVIGIVTAYDDPTITADLKTFSSHFHLTAMHGLTRSDTCSIEAGPHPCFVKISIGSTPRTDAGWGQETSLDVEWAHATAPDADIILSEAKSAGLTDLFAAIDNTVAKKASVVSMSWGGSEFSTETRYDSHFQKDGVSFVASSGDDGHGTSYPAASPSVMSVGGTTLILSASGTVIGQETAWSGSGGGTSTYEAQPRYQTASFLHGKRGTPDVSYDADPETGVAVYDSTPYQNQSGWFEVGGTSAGAPQWAGILSLANQLRITPLTTNNQYPAYTVAAAKPSSFKDITAGTNGFCGQQCQATSGYDLTTGLGTPVGKNLLPTLQNL